MGMGFQSVVTVHKVFLLYFIYLLQRFVYTDICFQMFNCCIERKKAREGNSYVDHRRKSESDEEGTSKKKSKNNATTSEGWDLESPPISSDEEFFECDDNEEEPMETSNTSAKEVQPQTVNQSDSLKVRTSQSEMNLGSNQLDSSSQLPQSQSELSALTFTQSNVVSSQSSQDGCDDKSSVRVSSSQETDFEGSFAESWSHMPEGRRGPYLQHKLINNSKEVLYVPITQEPSPMTEDMLDEHAEVLARWVSCYKDVYQEWEKSSPSNVPHHVLYCQFWMNLDEFIILKY